MFVNTLRAACPSLGYIGRQQQKEPTKSTRCEEAQKRQAKRKLYFWGATDAMPFVLEKEGGDVSLGHG